MERKKLIWIFMAIGSYAGGYIPSLWNAGMFSIWGILLSAVGGIAGIWLAFKMSE
jgi:hypothetical protein